MYIIACLTSIQILLIGVYSTDVRLPPTIIRGPVESMIFRGDDYVELECLASGIPKPNYEWFKNGHPLQFPSLQGNLYRDEGTLTIRPLTVFDEGYFQCAAWNQYGRALSNASVLRRAISGVPNPNVEITESEWVEEGMPHMLSCIPTKFYPKPIYSWAMTRDRIDETQFPITTGKRIQIDEQGNLHFSYVTMADAQDGKVYKCNMFNPNMDITMGGSYSRLRVRPARGGMRSFGPVPKFSSHTPVVALEGRNVTIRCFFSGNPEPMITWLRREPDSSLPIGRYELKNYNTELMLQRVQPSDEGEYRCIAHNDKGSNFNTIHIDVQAAPIFVSTNDRPHNLNVTEGKSVVIFCRAYADPEATVVWLRNGQPIDFEEHHKYRLSDNDKQLTISNVCKNCPDTNSNTDLAVIQCNASNVHGYAFGDGYINILEKTSIIVKPEDIFVEEGELSASFSCEAKSDDSTSVTITWYHVYEYGDVSDERVRNVPHRVFIGPDNSLTFSVDNYTDWINYRGRYRCEAGNGYSTDSAEAILDADDLPMPPAPDPVLAGLGDMWWIFLIVAIIMLILILLICCCICLQRNKGDTYPVDKKERKNGNDPEKELSAGGFHDYQRPEGEPLKGSRASLSSSIKMDSDEEASLNEYGELDPGKFTEDGSFIGDYGVEKRRGKAGDHQV